MDELSDDSSSSSSSRSSSNSNVNLNTTQVDNEYVNEKLKESSYLLQYLSSKNRQVISVVLRKKVSTLIERFNQLLISWIASNTTQDGYINDELWGDNFLMKYLFKDFIRETSLNHQLECKLCNTSFPCKSIHLIAHLKSRYHIINYEKVRSKQHAYDEDFWGDFHLMKFLFDDYVIRIRGEFYCKICSDKFDREFILDHVKSVVHIKAFNDIVNFNHQGNSKHTKLPYEEILNSLEAVQLEKKEVKVKCGSNLAINTHDEFLKGLFQIKVYNKYTPIFCQLCCVFQLTINLEGPPTMTSHIKSYDHMSAVFTIDESDLIKYNCKYCQFCSAYFFCTGPFFNYHFKCHCLCSRRPDVFVTPNNNNIAILDFMSNVVGKENYECGIFGNSLVQDSNFVNKTTKIEVNDVCIQTNNHGLFDVAQITKDSEISDVAQITKDSETSDVAQITKDSEISDVAQITKDCETSDVAQITRYSQTSDVVVTDEKDMYRVLKSLSVNIDSLIDGLSTGAIFIGAYLGLFCYPCKYWSTDIHEWTSHINRNELHKYYCNVNASYTIQLCDCFILFVGDKAFRKAHNMSNRHARLCDLIKKARSNQNSVLKSPIGNVQLQYIDNLQVTSDDVNNNFKSWDLNGTENEAMFEDSVICLTDIFNELSISADDVESVNDMSYNENRKVDKNTTNQSTDSNKVNTFKTFPQVKCLDDSFLPWQDNKDNEVPDDSKSINNSSCKFLRAIDLTNTTTKSDGCLPKKLSIIESKDIRNDISNSDSDCSKFPLLNEMAKEEIESFKDVSVYVDNLSETSSSNSCRQTLGKHDKCGLSSWNAQNKKFVFGLSDLKPGTQVSVIEEAFKEIGDIHKVEFINSTAVNITINIRTDKKLYGSTIGINGQRVFIGPLFKSKNDGTFKSKNDDTYKKGRTTPEFIKTNFASYETFLIMVDMLTHNAKDAAIRMGIAESIDKQTSRPISREECLLNSLKKCCSSIINLQIIGSRETMLADEDSIYDVFVEFDPLVLKGLRYEDGENERIKELVACLTLSLEFNCIIVTDVNHFRTISVTYTPLSIDCRLFPTLGFVIENTSLIKNYICCDKRVETLLLIVREWAKQTNLSNVISQYSVTWMVLFYLMTQGVELIEPRNKMVLRDGKSIAGWYCHNYKDPSQLREAVSNVNVQQLFCGFLFYYSDTSIKNLVLCPRFGTTVSKEWLRYRPVRKMSLIKSRKMAGGLYKRDNRDGKLYFPITDGICLQDPIELHINLTLQLTDTCLNEFKGMCKCTLNELRTFKYR